MPKPDLRKELKQVFISFKLFWNSGSGSIYEDAHVEKLIDSVICLVKEMDKEK